MLSLLKNSQWDRSKSGENLVEQWINEAFRDDFRKNVALIGGDRQVAVVERVRGKRGPGAVNFAADDSATEEEHGVAVAVIGAVAAVLFDAPAELAHSHNRDA